MTEITYFVPLSSFSVLHHAQEKHLEYLEETLSDSNWPTITLRNQGMVEKEEERFTILVNFLTLPLPIPKIN